MNLANKTTLLLVAFALVPVLIVSGVVYKTFAPLSEFLDFFLMFSFMVVLVSVFLGLIVAKRLTNSIRLLVSAVAAFASHAEQDIAIPPSFLHANDEIGVLWREFRSMSENIADYHKNLEDEVKKRTEELEAFSYSVSHDLRAPLRAMDGFAKVFMEEYGGTLDEEGKRIMLIIQKNAAQMGRLIDDLIAFSRLGRQEMKKASVSMRALAQSVLDELRETAIDRKADIRIGEMPDAFGSGDMIRLVFTNLLSNAIKFSGNKEKPEIEIGGYEEGGAAVYYVKDKGVGFDMKYADKLFKVFQRLHTEQEFEGTGIGLANVKRIIERHGGTVRAQGEVGKGATFYFTLPINQDDSDKTVK